MDISKRSYRAIVTKVLDGDTFDAFVDLGLGVSIEKRVRILSIDTPELGEEHHQEAVEATKVLRDLLRVGQVIITTDDDKHDQYGRVLAQVLVLQDGGLIDVGQLLIQKGLARPWY